MWTLRDGQYLVTPLNVDSDRPLGPLHVRNSSFINPTVILHLEISRVMFLFVNNPLLCTLVTSWCEWYCSCGCRESHQPYPAKLIGKCMCKEGG